MRCDLFSDRCDLFSDVLFIVFAIWIELIDHLESSRSRILNVNFQKTMASLSLDYELCLNFLNN